MSQSSVDEQVKSLQESGFPVRKGVRMAPAVNPNDVHKFGSDLWLSRWSRNVFRNYPIVSKATGVRFLADACKGMPCFVVGVGPSLDDHAAELREAKNRAIVISTDAALRALLANGVTPDLVISYDCKPEQKKLWETIVKAPPCLFSSCAHPDSIASWPGPVLFYNQYHTQDELCKVIIPTVLPELGQIPSCGTVGNMAIMTAHLLGCDPICTIGMDFCYRKTGPETWQYRAKDYRWTEAVGCDLGKWIPTEIKELYDNDERMSRAYIVKGDEGKEFMSDPELSFYLESFKDLMPHFKIPIVNCSPDGMIPSTYTTMPVVKVIDTYCKTEFQGGRSIIKHLATIIPDPRKV